MTSELNAWLDERLAQERQRLLELVVGVVELILTEQIQRDGAACGQQFADEFAKLQHLTDQMQNTLEKLMVRLDRAAARVEAIDMKMN